MRIAALVQQKARVALVPLLVGCTAAGAKQAPALFTPATQPAAPAPPVDTAALVAATQRQSAPLGSDCWSPLLGASAPQLNPGTTLNTAIGVDAQGSVQSVSIAADANAPASLIQCVEARVWRWHFAGVRGLPAAISVPLVFVTPDTTPKRRVKAARAGSPPLATGRRAIANADDCAQYYTVDDRGIRRLRPECLDRATLGASSPQSSAPSALKGCSPPYWVDASGIRRLRPECL